jgi:hypothetical protein
VGRTEEAEDAFLSAERGLTELAGQHDSLQVAFMLAQTRVRLGTLYAARAEGEGLSPDRQLEYWRTARERLAQAVPALEKINAVIPLDGTGKEMFDGGVKNLAAADAAIARLAVE